MNPIRVLIAVIGVAALIFVSTLMAQEASLKDPAIQEPALKVAGVGGTVLVKIAPSVDWVDAKPEQVLNPKDSIKTGDNSTAMLIFSDKSTLALKPNTEIGVEELVWDAATRKAGLNMPVGALRAILKKVDGPSDFKVKTPTAICGARGTVFYVMASGTETRVFVTEGSIDFTNMVSNNSYVVIQDMMAIAQLSGTTTEPRELTGEEKEQVLAGWTGVIAETYTDPIVQDMPGQNSTFDPKSQNTTQESPAVENKGQEDNPASPV